MAKSFQPCFLNVAFMPSVLKSCFSVRNRSLAFEKSDEVLLGEWSKAMFGSGFVATGNMDTRFITGLKIPARRRAIEVDFTANKLADSPF